MRTLMLGTALTTTLFSSVVGGLPADNSPHHVSFVSVAPDVNVEVLDWGGNGPAMLLLAGLGGTVHVFDEFAPHLTNRFHVIGITRRGFGASSAPDNGYDTATLAHDDVAVLDKLGIGRAVLVSHSMAGAEMTTFAAAYPQRVLALVYLDSAYDFTLQPKTPLPQQRQTTDEAASISGMNDFLKRTLGVRFPESEWEATSEFNPNGSFRRMKASNELYQKVLTAAAHPPFGKVHAPALAICAQVEIRSVFPDYDNLDAQNQQRAEGYAGELKARAEASMRQLCSELPTARVVVLNPANHAVFLSNESDVLSLMQDFLANVK